jgi:FixJ family two-component response regulator
MASFDLLERSRRNTDPGRCAWRHAVKHSPVIGIVDDDFDVRQSLRNFLRSAGIDVRTFGSAEEFLATAAMEDIDCLLTDLHMDGMDGLELQAELNRQETRFPVIVMTAFPTPDVERRSLRLGAAAFLTKPIDPDALLERMERVIA